MARDSIALMPASVAVGFPAVSGGKVPCACADGSHWTVNVTPADVGLTTITQTTPGQVRYVRSTAMAIFTEFPEKESSSESSSSDASCLEPENAADLRAIAQRIALAFYAWREAPNRDITFPGSLPWVLDGTTDTVTISYRPDECRTRVRGTPYLFEPEDLYHATEEDFAGAGYLTDWVYAITPPEGIPGRAGTSLGPLGMGKKLCEILEENATGEPIQTGRFDWIYNPWFQDTQGAVLIRAELRRQPGGRCYLVVTEEDCVE